MKKKPELIFNAVGEDWMFDRVNELNDVLSHPRKNNLTKEQGIELNRERVNILKQMQEMTRNSKK